MMILTTRSNFSGKKFFIVISLIVSLIVLFIGSVQYVEAQGIKNSLCGGAEISVKKADTDQCAQTARDKDPEAKVNGLFETILNVFSIIVGVIAVVMIIFGGLKFITSSGDAGRLTSAKQTIIYALIGLIIVALSQFIVRFVLTKI